MLEDSSKASKNNSEKSPNFGPLSALAVTLLAYLGPQLIVVFLIGLYLAITNKDESVATNFLSGTTFGQFIFMCAIQLLTLGIIFWFVRKRRISLSSIGLGRKPSFKDVGLASVYFIGYMFVTGYLLMIVNNFIPAVDLDQEQQLGFESAQGFLPLFMVFVSLVVLPPIVEEIMIRGLLYGGLRKKMTKIVAALIASFLFGIAHLQLGSGAPPLYAAAIDTFLLSMVLIYLREKTGSLWAGIFVHAFKNGLAFMVLFVLNVA